MAKYYHNVKDKMNPLLWYSIRGLSFGILAPLMQGLDKIGLAYPIFRQINKNTPMNTKNPPYFAQYTPTKHDIFVCTYSKAGTNWMMQMAYQIAFKGQGEYEHIHDVVPWPDGTMMPQIPLTDTSIQASSPTGLRVIKSHVNWDAIPYSPESFYISVIRDPKDVFVSNYFFVQDIGFGAMMPSVETWLRTYLSDAFFLGSWAEHLAGYWAQRDKANVLLVYYHDLIQNRAQGVQAVADFLGVTLTEAEFQAVNEKSSFEYMKAIDHKFYPGQLPQAYGTGSMMRKGKQGSARDLLTPEQERRIDDFMRSELRRLGCDFPYDEMFSA